MTRLLFVFSFLALLLCGSCGHGKTSSSEEAVDTLPQLVTQIRKCSKLYTAAFHVRKIVVHTDRKQVKAEVMHMPLSVDVPLSSRRVAIPIDATVKAVVDFGAFSEKNIRRKGQNIEVILPDPVLMLTSTKIDHAAIKEKVSLFRSNFTDEELSNLALEGRKSIAKELNQSNLLELARANAARTLIPLFVQMGFAPDAVKVTFRRNFTWPGNWLKTLNEMSTSYE